MPTERALQEAGINDHQQIGLLTHLATHRADIGARLVRDRDLAARFVNDPASALKEMGVPAELIPAPHSGTDLRDRVAAQFGGVSLDISRLDPLAEGEAAPAATSAAVQLLADTMALGRTEATYAPLLDSDPGVVVREAARRHPPQGLSTAAAQTSVISQVTQALVNVNTGSSGSSSGHTGPGHGLVAAEDRPYRIPVPRDRGFTAVAVTAAPGRIVPGQRSSAGPKEA